MFLGKTVYEAIGSDNKQQFNHNHYTSINMNNELNSSNDKKQKIYTHIHTDPIAIIKEHTKERAKSTKQKEEVLLNLTKCSNPLKVSFLNNSNSQSNTNKINLNLSNNK